MSTPTLVHRTPSDDHDLFGIWTATPADGTPPITDQMESALRRELATRHDGDSVRWQHCDGLAWDAVVRAHQAGYHDLALSLAMLLLWCDRQHTRRELGMWEIAPEGSDDDERPA